MLAVVKLNTSSILKILKLLCLKLDPERMSERVGHCCRTAYRILVLNVLRATPSAASLAPRGCHFGAWCVHFGALGDRVGRRGPPFCGARGVGKGHMNGIQKRYEPVSHLFSLRFQYVVLVSISLSWNNRKHNRYKADMAG